MCAAPGGKTMQLVDGGANVTALDISRNRMKVLKENLERVNFDANLVTTDIFSYKEDEEYDIVLFLKMSNVIAFSILNGPEAILFKVLTCAKQPSSIPRSLAIDLT